MVEVGRVGGFDLVVADRMDVGDRAGHARWPAESGFGDEVVLPRLVGIEADPGFAGFGGEAIAGGFASRAGVQGADEDDVGTARGTRLGGRVLVGVREPTAIAFVADVHVGGVGGFDFAADRMDVGDRSRGSLSGRRLGHEQQRGYEEEEN